ncbi:hypothetical protein BJ878DRAFT_546940 [Calycina marina]|uniref:DUF7908 domain-containing protein n=1 Tax=Calycina marina TaxID=1763456 RepID=A0A9P7YU84_9HELO|nr:hypothetical protein BJ878DRAFT_546940 [Calycina marina]
MPTTTTDPSVASTTLPDTSTIDTGTLDTATSTVGTVPSTVDTITSTPDTSTVDTSTFDTGSPISTTGTDVATNTAQTFTSGTSTARSTLPGISTPPTSTSSTGMAETSIPGSNSETSISGTSTLGTTTPVSPSGTSASEPKFTGPGVTGPSTIGSDTGVSTLATSILGSSNLASSTSRPGTTPTGTTIPDGVRFFLRIDVILEVAAGSISTNIKRRQSYIETSNFLYSSGSFTTDCSLAEVYYLEGGNLFARDGGQISTDQTSGSVVMQSSPVIHEFASLFSIQGTLLTWQNAAFASGNASFCLTSSTNDKLGANLVYAILDNAPLPDCLPVRLSTLQIQDNCLSAVPSTTRSGPIVASTGLTIPSSTSVVLVGSPTTTTVASSAPGTPTSTSKIYATRTHIITSCHPTARGCHVGKTSTELVPLSTVVHPTGEKPGASAVTSRNTHATSAKSQANVPGNIHPSSTRSQANVPGNTHPTPAKTRSAVSGTASPTNIQASVAAFGYRLSNRVLLSAIVGSIVAMINWS